MKKRAPFPHDFVPEPEDAAEQWHELPSRRRFLRLMSASLALAGLSACRKPVEKIMPYVKGLEESVPGLPVFYASTMPHGIHPAGVLVTTFDGRPTKIDGLAVHPAALGGSDIHMQAAVLDLYDPDRSQQPQHAGAGAEWVDFTAAWKKELTQLQSRGGEGLAVLTESFASPTLSRLQQELAVALPGAIRVCWDGIQEESLLEAARAACGQAVYPLAHFARAEVVVCLDADALYGEGEHLRHAHGFAASRALDGNGGSMSRLYVAEPTLTLTGGAADHRLRCEATRVAALASALAAELGRQGLTPFANWPAPHLENAAEERWIAALARDLLAHRGKGLLIAGRRQLAEVHLLLFALNQALGHLGTTLDFMPLAQTALPATADLARLTAKMAAGEITHLVILGGNPAYAAPVDLDFAAALRRVGFSVHLSDRVDETSILTTWHLPAAHFLESWGDCRSVESRLSVIQPMIAPLFASRSAAEVMALLARGEEHHGYDLVRETWKGLLPASGYEKSWRQMLHDGISPLAPASPLQPDLERILAELRQQPAVSSSLDKLEVIFQPSALLDGRYANNAWLQEVPDPVTKIAWDNPARISHELAREAGLANGEMVQLSLNGRSLRIPVWIVPGQAVHSVTLELGYGRTRAGRVGTGVGFDVGVLRSSASPGFAAGATIAPAGGRFPIACAQEYAGMAGRPLVRQAGLEEFRHNPGFARAAVEHPPLKSLWKDHDYKTGYQWGMVIDLNACIGCNACTIACQCENNIPVVGKTQVAKGREMHWIRLDRYFNGTPDDPEMVHQPVACQHCETAPCEQVCPVGATVHDHEGLNVMAYNRCVGTRYCSNNCPYKARRFNFFDYTQKMAELRKMVQNPDVTVRMRGVMEKCTYCLQRLTLAKNKARLEGRRVADGEVRTACQQACPTGAITFGNLLDPESAVSRARASQRSYALLEELNVRPRTCFAARLRNRNPELV